MNNKHFIIYNKVFKRLFTATLALCLLIVSINDNLIAQSFQTEFGKNRVQYHDFEWSFYESENFIVYFYQGGQDLAKYALKLAETELPDIQKKLEHQTRDKIELMVYHNISDLRQTNIGQQIDENNTGGTTQIAANKVFVYFNGDHDHLKKQIVKGIAKVHFENLVFGSSFQEIIQNAVLLNLPEWFSEGLTRYITEDWNSELDDRLTKIATDKRFKNFNKLDGEDALFAGHALWYYLAQNHGETSIPNILYLTRINRSVESGFLFVLGLPTNKIVEEWWNHVQLLAENKNSSRTDVKDGSLVFKTKKRHRAAKIDKISVSPNGDKLVYNTNEKGLKKIFLYDLKTDKKKRIVKTGFKSYMLPINANYPIYAWNKKGSKLGIIYEKRDEIKLVIHDFNKEEVEEFSITKFQQIFDIAFSDDERRLVLSAAKNGQADLFTYFISNARVTQLTNDFYDDLDLEFVTMDDRRGIIFRSNRPNDTLVTARFDSIFPKADFDLFFLDMSNDDPELFQLTDTPNANEENIQKYDDRHVAYMSDQNGIQNRFVLKFDTVFIRTDKMVFSNGEILINPKNLDSLQTNNLVDSIQTKDIYTTRGDTKAITNYNSNIRDYNVSSKSGKLFELIDESSIFSVIKKPKIASDSIDIILENTAFQNYKNKVPSPNKSKKVTGLELQRELDILKPKEEEIIAEELNEIEEDSTLSGYYFQSEFDYLPKYDLDSTNEAGNFEYRVMSLEENRRKRIRLSRVRGYSTKFAIDYLAGQLDNSIIAFHQYQSYNLEPNGNFNPDLKGMLKFGASDLFEDHKILAGFRIPIFNFEQFEFFTNYRNLEKQLDKHYTYYRKSNTFKRDETRNDPTEKYKLITNFFQYTLSYPFDITSRLALNMGYRQDKKIALSSKEFLDIKPEYEQWLQLKLEYIFDNTFNITPHILSGLRYKLYTEVHKPFSAVINDSDIGFNIKDTGWMGVVGGDIRHYKKIHRQIIWANRFSFASSFGSKGIVYFLGAVDNWITLPSNNGNTVDNPRFDTDIPVDPEGKADYAFQSLTPNLRGFKFNVRNGSKYALFNSEIRIPIVTYLFNRPVRQQFFRDLQISAFTDIGTAWDVGNPFSEENRYTTYVYDGITEDSAGNSPVVVRVQYYKNPIVIGYGFGARSTFLGYYVKFDKAWGVDSGHRNEGMWYFSIGKDF